MAALFVSGFERLDPDEQGRPQITVRYEPFESAREKPLAWIDLVADVIKHVQSKEETPG